VHRYYREDPREYFAAVEEILRDLGGRPHWGKMHTQTAGTLREVYPRFDDFLRVRDELDPERRFANPYLDRVLGGPTTASPATDAPATESAGAA
jgi:L-gulono-1,4-lactone dehydrogenase